MKTIILSGIIVTLFVLGISPAVAADRTGSVRIESVTTGDEKFDRAFREARELIDKEDWAAAVAKLSEIVCDCPDKKGVDAAFYWLAFSYRKLNKIGEMNVAIDRLQKNFPSSSWVDDARVLRLRATDLAYVRSTSGSELTRQALATVSEDQTTPLEREEEVRLAAFQTLFLSEPARAITILGDIIVPNSKASENLQVQLLRSVRGSVFGTLTTSNGGLTPAYPTPGQTVSVTSNQSNLATVRTQESRSAINKQLGDLLATRFPSLTSIKIKSEIVHIFGTFEDAPERLGRLYESEPNKQIRKSIILALGGGIATFSLINNPAARKGNLDRLVLIVRAESDPELRVAAIRSMGSVLGGTKSDEVVDALSQVYSNDANEELKSAVVMALARMKSPRANARVIEIARSDRSDRIRLEAIRSLRGSDDPQVIKFLEELIR